MHILTDFDSFLPGFFAKPAKPPRIEPLSDVCFAQVAPYIHVWEVPVYEQDLQGIGTILVTRKS